MPDINALREIPLIYLALFMGIIVIQRIYFLKMKAVWYDYFLEIPSIGVFSIFAIIGTFVHFDIWETMNDFTIALLILPFIGGITRNLLAYKHGDPEQKKDIATRYKKAGLILLGGVSMMGVLMVIFYVVELFSN